jgi:hypothetical protein
MEKGWERSAADEEHGERERNIDLVEEIRDREWTGWGWIATIALIAVFVFLWYLTKELQP